VTASRAASHALRCIIALVVALAAHAAPVAATEAVYLDFYGEDAIIARDADHAIRSLLEDEIVEFGAISNAGGKSAQTLFKEYRVAEDDEALTLILPAMCRANRHICSGPEADATCAGGLCLKLERATSPVEFQWNRCRRLYKSKVNSGVPAYVLCVPHIKASVDYAFVPEFAADAPMLTDRIFRQLGACAPSPSEEACLRVERDTFGRSLHAPKETLPVRRLRVLAYVKDESARQLLIEWFARFLKETAAQDGDLRPPSLRIRLSDPPSFSSQQEQVEVYASNASVQMTPGCSAVGHDCLNEGAFTRMGATKFLGRRAPLAKFTADKNMGLYVVAFEDDAPLIRPADPREPSHCAVKTFVPEQSRNRRIERNQQASSDLIQAAALPGRQASPGESETIAALCNEPSIRQLPVTGQLPEAILRRVKRANHALGVIGVINASKKYDGENSPDAAGVFPGLIVPVVSFQKDQNPDEQPRPEGVTNLPAATSDRAGGRKGQTDLPSDYQSARENGFGGETSPTAVNFAIAGPLGLNVVENHNLFGDSFLWPDTGSIAPLIVVSAGNGLSDPALSVEKLKQAPSDQQQDVYKSRREAVNRARYGAKPIETADCAIWPACLSVAPVINPDDAAQKQSLSGILVSVVGLNDSGTRPIAFGETAAVTGPNCDLSEECAFYGPAFDIAAIGEVNMPAITAVKKAGRQWQSGAFGFRRDRGSSYAAPFVSGLAVALHAEDARVRSGAPQARKYETTRFCKAAAADGNTPDAIKGHIKSQYLRAKLLRDRILSSADFMSWPENLRCAAKCDRTRSDPNAPAPDDLPMFKPRFAQFGRVNFDAALDFTHDCLKRMGSSPRNCAAASSLFRVDPRENNPLNPQSSALPAVFVRTGFTPGSNPKAGSLSDSAHDEDSKRDDDIRKSLATEFAIPTADIRRIERIDPAKISGAVEEILSLPQQGLPEWTRQPFFRIVFVDRYDPTHPFTLRHIVGAQFIDKGSEQVTIGSKSYQPFFGLPLADTAGALSNTTVRPSELQDFLSAWPADCGRVIYPEAP